MSLPALRALIRRAPRTLLALAATAVLVPAAQAAPPAPTDPTKVWQETFTDDFSSPVLDITKWTPCYWWANGGCTNSGNNEQQWYLPTNVVMEDGMAKLRAKKETVLGAGGKAFDYTSGMITTGRDSSLLSLPPRYQFKYGYMEMRAKVPAGMGLWPAFWALPSSHTWPPEIDAMEIKGHEPTKSYMGVHYKDASGANAGQGGAWSGPDFSQDFHTFGVKWEENLMVWYIDGVVRFWVTDPAAIPDEPMYLLANLAVGGSWVGAPNETTPFPSDLAIDYIRVWQEQQAQQEPPPVEPTPTPEPEPTPTPAPDTTAPTVQVTAPANGTTVKRGTNVTLAATATDSVGVTEVAFTVDGKSVCTDQTAPYMCTWKAPAKKGTAQISARASDAAGNAASSTVTVKIA